MDSGFNFPYYNKIKELISDATKLDIENFANVFYVENISKITGHEKVFSAYIPIDLSEFRCLLESYNNDLLMKNQTLKNDMAEVCTVSGIVSSELMYQSKFVEQYKVETATKVYAIKIRKLSNVYVEFHTELADSKIINEYNENLSSCNYSDFRGAYSIKSDRFTNEFLIALFLDYFYTNHAPPGSGLNGYAKHYIGTILNYPNEQTGILSLSNKYGIELMDYYPLMLDKVFTNEIFAAEHMEQYSTISERGPYNIIIPMTNVLINILCQVLCNLHFLNTNVHFLHGNLTLDNIAVDNTKGSKINYTVTNGENFNITTESNFSIYMLGFSSSSISFSTIYYGDNKVIKFYPGSSSKLASGISNIFPFSPKIEEYDGTNVFLVDNILDVTLLNNARHSGIGFPPAFDVYVFMISCFLNPSIFHRIFSNSILKVKLWDVMWVQKEEVDAFKRIYNLVIRSNKTANLADILEILKGKHMKCQILHILLVNLAELSKTYK